MWDLFYVGFSIYNIYMYMWSFLSFQRTAAQNTMSKTFLDADMDAEMAEMEKEEGDSDGEEEEAEGKKC